MIPISPNKFQFHKGTIRTINSERGFSNVGDFNSIKVRLEREANFKSNIESIFQFHKGTIITLNGKLNFIL